MVDYEVEYDLVLVLLVDGVYDELVIVTVVKLVVRKWCGIYVFVFVIVFVLLLIGVWMFDVEVVVEILIEQARVQVGVRVFGYMEWICFG